MRLRLSTLILLLGFWTLPSFGQGCAMCYSTAAAASKDGQKAINRAVLVLLVPPVGFMTLGIGMAVRYSRKRDAESTSPQS
jgi:hypothetical protein